MRTCQNCGGNLRRFASGQVAARNGREQGHRFICCSCRKSLTVRNGWIVTNKGKAAKDKQVAAFA